MITRIVYTSFWVNSVQENLSLESQHLYIYLITCPYIGICSVFRLPDQYLLLETLLSKTQLDKAKEELIKKKKAYFYDGWINLASAEKFINYKKSPDNVTRYLKEISFIPKDVLSKLSYKVDSSVGVVSTVPINNKQEIINDKSKTIIEDIKKRFPIKKI